MFWFLQAGLVAAGSQFIAVAIITLLTSLLAPIHFSWSARDAELFWISVSPLLAWVYLLSATGFSLTSNRFVHHTSERIRRASSLMRHASGARAPRALAAQLGLSTILLAILALRTPPEPLIEIGRYFGCICVSCIGWAGILSVGVACCGATTQAALRAY
jgi:hypothetical protein